MFGTTEKCLLSLISCFISCKEFSQRTINKGEGESAWRIGGSKSNGIMTSKLRS